MPTPTPLQSEPNEAHLTAAVQRCCEAYHRVLAIPRPLDGKGSSKNFAEEAYRQAMPFLTSFDNIDAFIACVTHGMLLDAIDYDHGSKLLYAAQVAIASRRARQHAARDHAKMHPTPSPSPMKEAPLPAQSLEPAPPAASPEAQTPPPSPADPARAPSLLEDTLSSKAGDPSPTPSPAPVPSTPAMPPPATAQAAPQTNLII